MNVSRQIRVLLPSYSQILSEMQQRLRRNFSYLKLFGDKGI